MSRWKLHEALGGGEFEDCGDSTIGTVGFEFEGVGSRSYIPRNLLTELPPPLRYPLEVVGLSATPCGHNEAPSEQHYGVQFCVVEPDSSRYVYGDQEWVRTGRALEHHADGSHIERRTVDITYGEWEKA